METRVDADWCWHCGYSYEEAEARATTTARNERIDVTASEEKIAAAAVGRKRTR